MKANEKKGEKEKRGKNLNAEKKPKPEKVEKSSKPEKTARHASKGGVSSVEVVQVPPGELAACSFEARTGHLVLQIPQVPQGPRGKDGHQGVPGIPGEPGVGIDYSQAPGGKDDFFLFIDRNGRLCYHSLGEVALVNLVLTTPPGEDPTLA